MTPQHPRARAVTIHDVAARARVSIGTVSLALRDDPRCASSTVARVKAAAADLRYTPNHVARSLRRSSTETITLVVPDIGNPVYVTMAKVVQREARNRGYRLSLVSSDGERHEELSAVDGLARRHADGLIICSLRPDPALVRALETAHAPVCVIGRLPDGARVDNVRVDSELGVEIGVAQFVAMKRERIGFVNGTLHTVPATARLEGFKRALRSHGLPFADSLVTHAEFSLEGGYVGASTLLVRHRDLNAMFCANDVMAIGALRCLRERGLRVPEDLAVIGMDDIAQGQVCTPTLTSVSLQAEERGALAAKLLFERLSSDIDLEPRRVMVQPRLVARESSPGGIT
jgi:LacI family transcriptional regulator